MRLKPSWEASIERLKTLGDGVFTVVVQQGEVRQVAKRSKDVDNGNGAGVFSPHDGNTPAGGIGRVTIEKI